MIHLNSPYFFSNTKGFTLIETIATLAIIGILTVVALEKSSISNSDLVAIEAGLKTHIRFAQAKAMQSNTVVWGIRINANSNRYWLFNCAVGQNCSFGRNRSIPPGGQGGEMDVNGDRLDTDLLNVDISGMTADGGTQSFLTLVFNPFGVPWYNDRTAITFTNPISETVGLARLTDNVIINLSDNSGNQSQISISSETGFVQ